MSEPENENVPVEEEMNQEIRREDLFCSRCVRFFRTKDEFSQHTVEHIEESHSSRGNYMNYIEDYICSNCGKTFEVVSDFNIHCSTDCLNTLYTCKHCRQDCEDYHYLQMHLLVHHNYSEEMLYDVGFVTNVNDNPYKSQCSFMKDVRSKAFKSPSPEATEEFSDEDYSTFANISFFNSESLITKSKRQDLAFNLRDKRHTCEICNESFSRKCVLDMHARKHALKQAGEKQLVRNISENLSTMEIGEYDCIPAGSSKPKNGKIDSFEGTSQHSNSTGAILQPSNVVLGSSIWKKIQPKSGFKDVKTSVFTGSMMEKSINTDISEITGQYPSSSKPIFQPYYMVLDSPIWKKVQPENGFKDMNALVSTRSTRRKSENADISEVAGQPSKIPKAILKPSNAVPSTSIWKKFKPKRKFEDVTAFDEQKVPESLNIAKKSEVGKTGRKSKNNISEVAGRQSKIPKAILKPSNAVLGTSIWKKFEPKSKFENVTAFDEQKVPVSLNIAKKSEVGKTGRKSKSSISKVAGRQSKIPKPVLIRSNVVLDSSVPKKVPKSLNIAKKSKSEEKRMKKPKNEGKELFICEICNRSLKDGYKLRRHSLVHSGERPYSCPKCKKTFSRDDHLKRHVKKVCSKTDKAE